MQGVEGAVFALREMFSGDAISMVRRFEMPKEVMNSIKKLDVKDQLVELDKYFNSIGMTQKLIDEMGNTTLGVFAQVSEQFQILMRDMGTPALKPLSNFLTGILTKLNTAKEMDGQIVFNPETGRKEVFQSELTKYQEFGKKIITNVIKGLTSSADKFYSWFTGLTANEDFKKKTTIYGKVKFIFDDIFDSFKKWLDNSGMAKIEKISKVLIQTLAAGADASIGAITPVATKIGIALGSGIKTGIEEAIDDSFILSILKGPVGLVNHASKKGMEIGRNLREKVDNKINKNKEVFGPPAPAHNGGADRIRRDGLYYLHKSEAVLNVGKADRYRKAQSEGAAEPEAFPRILPMRSARPAAVQQDNAAAPSNAAKGNGGGHVTFNIEKLVDYMVVREDADIDKIASKLAEKIYEAGEGGAVWRG